MDVPAVRKWIEVNGVEAFSRSSGPGGQNVNKVSTKALLRVSLVALEGVTDEERARLLAKLGAKLTTEGELIVQVQDERSQLLNRELAVERVMHTIEAALHRPKPRRKTKPTKASNQRRLAAKKAASQILRNRRVNDD
jgi:ribosome-associated protein